MPDPGSLRFAGPNVKIRHIAVSVFISLALGSNSSTQGNPKLENANVAVVRAFETHDIVMFGEIHGNKQE
jgi:hypothetical protein